jgi:hypothetical protein
MKWFFTDHSATVGESYGQHMRRALRSAVPPGGAVVACTVHALVPALFETTASRTATRLNDEITGLHTDDAE